MVSSPVGSPAIDGAPPEVFQYSLRALLLATALLSVPLTLLHWLGVNYLFSLALSTGLIGICCLAYKSYSPKALLLLAGLAIPASIVITILYFIVAFRFGGTEPFIVHTLINFVVCLACVLIHCSRKWLTIALCIAAVVPYVMKIKENQKIRHTYEQMLTDYPIESLEPRLSFEIDEAASEDFGQLQGISPVLSKAVASNLTDQEQRYETSRQWALTALHEEYSTQFAAAVGFGYIRMRRLYPDDLKPAPVEFAILPLPIQADLIGVNDRDDSDALHQAVSYDFLSRDKMGYVQDLQHVAGFQSHSPTFLAESINGSGCFDDDEDKAPPRWQLTRLELVSLQRHSPPRVYLSDHLPEMDKLGSFEHRALSSFENAALPKLVTEEDVVSEFDDGRILLIGALRASKDCLQCHQGNRGKLLGALSYELTRLDVPAGLAN